MPTHPSPATHNLLTKAFPPSQALSIFTDKLHRKSLHLHGTTPNARDLRRQSRLLKAPPRPKRKPQPLTAREKRALQVYTIPPEAQKYALYEPLHVLWTGYMHEVLRGSAPGAGQAQIGLKLASADFHGAIFEVVRSRCPSRVGIKGICVKETKAMFYIVTQKDRVKEVPKEHTVFRFTLPVESPPHTDELNDSVATAADNTDTKPTSMVFELHGSQLMYRGSERAGRKFKQKPALDL